jgi:mannosyltransferase OCH1-like enzyme
VIPRVLHQIWLGDAALPVEFEGYRESWFRNHPDWAMRLWTEENLPEGLRPEVYELLRHPVERSDILRLELLQREGGVYVDTDFECLQPLDPLLDGVEFFCAYLKEGRVNNAIVGAVPGHPLLARMLGELTPRTRYGFDKAGTGSLLLDRLVPEFPDVTIFPRELFYPRTPNERRDAIAVHHSARSWKPRELLMIDVQRAERKLARTQDELRETKRLYEAALAELGGEAALPRVLRRAKAAGVTRLRRLAKRR